MTKQFKTNEGDPRRKFTFFTDVLKAGGGDGEPMTLSGVASSTVEDLHGDKIERTALKDMEAAVAGGMTIFLNHQYNVPEDVAGYAEAAKVTKRGEDAEGNGVWDLDIDITINDENPRAVEAWRGISGGKWKAGLSIGANIPDDGFDYDRKTGKYTINHIQLLETSIVGIPANQRSWIAKALNVLKDEKPQTIEVNEDIEAEVEVKAEEIEEAPPADDRDDEPEQTEASGCPDCGEPEDSKGCGSGYHKPKKETSPEEPDSQDDDSAPEADPATPASEESKDADPSEVEALEGDPDPEAMLASLAEVEGEVTLTHLRSAVQVGMELAKHIATLTKQRDDAQKAQSEAERVLQETIEKANAYAREVHEIVGAVRAMPIGRKADKAKIESKAVSITKRLEQIYPPEFLKMLEKQSD